MKGKFKGGKAINEEIIKTVGGIVGHVVLKDRSQCIGMQFKYGPEKLYSPVYLFLPWEARYAGWHLFRRGVSDGIYATIQTVLRGYHIG